MTRKFIYLTILTVILGVVAALIGKFSAAKHEAVKDIIYGFGYLYLANCTLIIVSGLLNSNYKESKFLNMCFPWIILIECCIFFGLFFSIYGSASNCLRHLTC